jgi:hypothetical protein
MARPVHVGRALARLAMADAQHFSRECCAEGRATSSTGSLSKADASKRIDDHSHSSRSALKEPQTRDRLA